MIRAEEKLSKNVQRWIFEQGWQSLRPIQELAIEPIYSAQKDVLISAATAGGKTEAFFLPACSVIENQKEGVGILYISPLKALINDQYRRLESLTELLDIKLTPWHGDAPQSNKKKLKKNPSGIILITPESLESLLMNSSSWLRSAFKNLKYIAIDEFHAFLGTARGYQLLSLLNRLEHLLGRYENPIPRVALSATLGELEKVPEFLRPNKSFPCEIIKDEGLRSELLLQLKAFIDVLPNKKETIATKESVQQEIRHDIFNFCRGGNHLVFANSRGVVELVSADLRSLCEDNFLPNEFFPHHGSLSKELRHDLEQRLQQDGLPTTAICTMTLELGIDIGKVDSVIQLYAPNGVSSLRQRMGRSGRRNNPSKLRILIKENKLNEKSQLIDYLRLELIQSIAIVHLLIENKWFEPVEKQLFQFSTLLHQILAVIAQWGSIRAEKLFHILCKTGPFQNITTTHFKFLLLHMGENQLITQLGSGELVLGIIGERLTGNYSFYAAFQTPEEYRLMHGAKTLGNLPIDYPIQEGQLIIFAGQKWKIIRINTAKRVIDLESAKAGKAPMFHPLSGNIHSRIRQKMFNILCSAEHRVTMGEQKIPFINAAAQELFKEAVEFFHDNNLKEKFIFEYGGNVFIIPWLGDKILQTLSALLRQRDINNSIINGIIQIEKTKLPEVLNEIKKIISEEQYSAKELANFIPPMYMEKFDEYLPENLLKEGNGAKFFDIPETYQWLSSKQ